MHYGPTEIHTPEQKPKISFGGVMWAQRIFTIIFALIFIALFLMSG